VGGILTCRLRNLTRERLGDETIVSALMNVDDLWDGVEEEDRTVARNPQEALDQVVMQVREQPSAIVTKDEVALHL
jgi:hypothetical protein